MTDIQARQLAIVSVEVAASQINLNQMAMVAVTGEVPAHSDLRLMQLAVIYVMSPNSRCITPDRAMDLPCYSVGLSYGYSGHVNWRT